MIKKHLIYIIKSNSILIYGIRLFKQTVLIDISLN